MDTETSSRRSHNRRLTSGQGTRSARCGESRTPGAGRRPRETPGGNTGTAPWADLTRYWGGEIRDNEDLKARWAEIIPLYDYEYDPVRSAARVEAGIYRYEAHNWCFQHNMPGYDLKPQLPGVRCPTLVTVGRTDWITPVSSAETIASLIPDSRLVVFEKSGHSPQIEEADKFQAVVRDFLHDVLAETGTGNR